MGWPFLISSPSIPQSFKTGLKNTSLPSYSKFILLRNPFFFQSKNNPWIQPLIQTWGLWRFLGLGLLLTCQKYQKMSGFVLLSIQPIWFKDTFRSSHAHNDHILNPVYVLDRHWKALQQEPMTEHFPSWSQDPLDKVHQEDFVFLVCDFQKCGHWRGEHISSYHFHLWCSSNCTPQLPVPCHSSLFSTMQIKVSLQNASLIMSLPHWKWLKSPHCS